MRKIVAIETPSKTYFITPHFTQGIECYEEAVRFERAGEMAMVGWYRLWEWGSQNVVEVQEKFIVSITYGPDMLAVGEKSDKEG